MKRALTIAGSDCSGGAGIQADLKTFTAFGVYGMSAITVVVAENTVGVQAVFDIPVNIIVEQIHSAVSDIGTDAVKVGMLSTPEIVNAVADAIQEYRLSNVVVDPVMVAKSGDSLLSEAARKVLRDRMFPLATVITPNLYETEVLLGERIADLKAMQEAARELHRFGSKIVVIKGGHMVRDGSGERLKQAIDVIYDGSQIHQVSSPFFDTPNTHGTGCTFSSAIAAGLAKDYPALLAIERAKEYISKAIEHSLSLGRGHGPTNHLVGVESRW